MQRGAATEPFRDGVRAACLEGQRRLAPGDGFQIDDRVCAIEGLGQPGRGHLTGHHDVGVRLVGMHQRGAGRQSPVDPHRRRPRFDVQLHLLGQILGLSGCVADDHRHRLTHIAHPLPSQQRLGEPHVVGTVQHGLDVADTVGVEVLDRVRRATHGTDETARHRAAHEPHRGGPADVAHEHAHTAQQGRVFDPADGAADPAHGTGLCGY